MSRTKNGPPGFLAGAADLRPVTASCTHLTVVACHRNTTLVAAPDGRVYFASGDGKLHALDASDGRLLWSRQIGAPTAPTALILGPDGDIYLATTERKIIAVKTDEKTPNTKCPDRRRRHLFDGQK